MEQQKEWTNWSGSLKFTPAKIEKPASEEELARIVEKANQDNFKVRVVGRGHSSSPLVKTKNVLVSLENFQGIESFEKEKHIATIGTGMRLKEANKALLEIGMAPHNTGDVDVQTVAGAIGTGTHGTGKDLKSLSNMLLGGRLVTATGEIKEFSMEKDPEFLKAIRVSMGTFGIFTAIKLKLLPAYKLHRREWCCHVDTAMEHLDELIEMNRNFDFYWYPRNDEVKLRTLNKPEDKIDPLPYARVVEEKEGWIGDVLPKSRHLKFDEMEYSLPFEAGPACFQEVRKATKEKFRKDVGWRVLYRTVKADDAYLSTAYERETVTISLHQNANLPFWTYFKEIEPIFRAYGGRPHWGKKYTLRAAELKELYPKWEAFHKIRKQMDPKGVFMSSFMQEIFEEHF